MNHDGPTLNLRERIFAVARRTFASRSFAEASVSELALAAQTTKPMLYYYFGSKAGLYAAVVDDARARLFAALDPVTQSRELAPKKLTTLVCRLRELDQRDPDTVLLLRAARQTIASAESELERSITAKVGFILEEGEAQGAFRRVDRGLCACLVARAFSLSEVADLQDAPALADLLLYGLSTAPEA